MDKQRRTILKGILALFALPLIPWFTKAKEKELLIGRIDNFRYVPNTEPVEEAYVVFCHSDVVIPIEMKRQVAQRMRLIKGMIQKHHPLLSIHQRTYGRPMYMVNTGKGKVRRWA